MGSYSSTTRISAMAPHPFGGGALVRRVTQVGWCWRWSVTIRPLRSGPVDDGGVGSAMCRDPAGPGEEPAEAYSAWPLRDRLEPLAFDARLAKHPANPFRPV